jgi:hypothetical protein
MDPAKLLIQQAYLDANTTAMLCGILDDLWLSLEPRFTGLARMHGPLTIANALLHGTAVGLRDPAALEEHASVRAMALLGPEPAAPPG